MFLEFQENVHDAVISSSPPLQCFCLLSLRGIFYLIQIKKKKIIFCRAFGILEWLNTGSK
jgi:hypothetical protein